LGLARSLEELPLLSPGKTLSEAEVDSSTTGKNGRLFSLLVVRFSAACEEDGDEDAMTDNADVD